MLILVEYLAETEDRWDLRRSKTGQLFSAVVRSYVEKSRKARSRQRTRMGRPESYIKPLNRAD